MTAPRKKKFLKLNEDYGQGEDDLPSDNDADGDIDIRDVEFRLRNDFQQVKVILFNVAIYTCGDFR